MNKISVAVAILVVGALSMALGDDAGGEKKTVTVSGQAILLPDEISPETHEFISQAGNMANAVVCCDYAMIERAYEKASGIQQNTNVGCQITLRVFDGRVNTAEVTSTAEKSYLSFTLAFGTQTGRLATFRRVDMDSDGNLVIREITYHSNGMPHRMSAGIGFGKPKGLQVEWDRRGHVVQKRTVE